MIREKILGAAYHRILDRKKSAEGRFFDPKNTKNEETEGGKIMGGKF